MAADFNKPALTSTKTNFPQEIRDNVNAVAKMDYAGASNIQTNSIRWNSTTKKFEKYNGATWDAITARTAFSSVTVTPSAGVWTPSISTASYLQFQDSFFVNYYLTGTLSSASAPAFTITTSPALPAAVGYAVPETVYTIQSGPFYPATLAIKGTGDAAILLNKQDATNFATGTYSFYGQIIYPI